MCYYGSSEKHFESHMYFNLTINAKTPKHGTCINPTAAYLPSIKPFSPFKIKNHCLNQKLSLISILWWYRLL